MSLADTLWPNWSLADFLQLFTCYNMQTFLNYRSSLQLHFIGSSQTVTIMSGLKSNQFHSTITNNFRQMQSSVVLPSTSLLSTSLGILATKVIDIDDEAHLRAADHIPHLLLVNSLVLLQVQAKDHLLIWRHICDPPPPSTWSFYDKLCIM